MTDKEKLINAKKIYKIICDYFDKNKWVYNKREDELDVRITMQGSNMPMDIILEVDVKKDLINLYVKLPVVFNDEKRMDGALATSLINYRLYDEAFDYNVKSGEVFLRQTASFRGSVVTVTLIDYMMRNAIKTVNNYDSKLLALSEGKINLEDFNKSISAKK